jgi:hypothetical protein
MASKTILYTLDFNNQQLANDMTFSYNVAGRIAISSPQTTKINNIDEEANYGSAKVQILVRYSDLDSHCIVNKPGTTSPEMFTQSNTEKVLDRGIPCQSFRLNFKLIDAVADTKIFIRVAYD